MERKCKRYRRDYRKSRHTETDNFGDLRQLITNHPQRVPETVSSSREIDFSNHVNNRPLSGNGKLYRDARDRIMEKRHLVNYSDVEFSYSSEHDKQYGDNVENRDSMDRVWEIPSNADKLELDNTFDNRNVQRKPSDVTYLRRLPETPLNETTSTSLQQTDDGDKLSGIYENSLRVHILDQGKKRKYEDACQKSNNKRRRSRSQESPTSFIYHPRTEKGNISGQHQDTRRSEMKWKSNEHSTDPKGANGTRTELKDDKHKFKFKEKTSESMPGQKLKNMPGKFAGERYRTPDRRRSRSRSRKIRKGYSSPCSLEKLGYIEKRFESRKNRSPDIDAKQNGRKKNSFSSTCPTKFQAKSSQQNNKAGILSKKSHTSTKRRENTRNSESRHRFEYQRYDAKHERNDCMRKRKLRRSFENKRYNTEHGSKEQMSNNKSRQNLERNRYDKKHGQKEYMSDSESRQSFGNRRHNTGNGRNEYMKNKVSRQSLEDNRYDTEHRDKGYMKSRQNFEDDTELENSKHAGNSESRQSLKNQRKYSDYRCKENIRNTETGQTLVKQRKHAERKDIFNNYRSDSQRNLHNPAPLNSRHGSAGNKKNNPYRVSNKTIVNDKDLYIETEFESLLTKSHDDAAVFVGTQANNLEHYLWKNDNHKDIELLVNVLNKICLSTLTENKRKALYVLKERRFFNRKDVTIPMSLAALGKKVDCNYLMCLLTIATSSVELVEAEYTDMGQFIACIDGITKYLQEKMKTDIENKIQNLRDVLRNQTAGHEDCSSLQTNHEQDISNENVLPSIEEIRANNTFTLPKRSIEQAFPRASEYLRHIFVLFREDFTRPLKKGIRNYIEFKEHPESYNGAFRDDDIRIFENVHILNSRCNKEDGIIWQVQFDVSRYKRVNWNARSLLQYGTLVCLTCDEFRTIEYATVAKREPSDLREGKVEIAFIDCAIDSILAAINESFLMIECKANFTSYSSTLNAIKNMSGNIQLGERFPFSRYFVHMNQEINHPSYFDQKDFHKRLVSMECISKSDEIQGWEIDILDQYDLPDAQSLGLDYSQHNALFHGLTNELALIQGPPGTGKTVIGLKIVNILLNNLHLWRGENETPLIVLSYTNHALDQFLEEVLKMPVMRNCNEQELVRVGSRTESENLLRFNLSKKRRESINDLTLRARTALSYRENKHENTLRYLNLLKSGVLHEQYLYDVGIMSAPQYKSLTSKNCQWANGPENETVFCEWLAILSHDFETLASSCSKSVQNEQSIEIDHLDIDSLFDDEENENVVDEDSDLDIEDMKNQYIFENPQSSLESTDPWFAISEAILFNGTLSYSETDDNPSFWEMLNKENKDKILRSTNLMITNESRMTEIEAMAVENVWKLHLTNRWRLYRYWLHTLEEKLKEKKRGYERSYERAQKRYKEARCVSDVQILKRAKVVGMTTTRAARDIEMLRKIESSVVIVEEAAEIPEHHVIACLTSSCKHLILIGDHQQLRPSYNDYELSKEFKTNISLFERLIKAKLPYSQLQYQHRMRPEISALLKPHIYKHLQDHASVFNFRNIKGVDTNLYCISHNESENLWQEAESKSHMNQHEAMFVCELYRYLRLQGYRSSEITILTTYKDQMREIRKLVGKMETEDELLWSDHDFIEDEDEDADITVIRRNNHYNNVKEKLNRENRVRVSAVDNFQGEENKIILLSLVRSNLEERIGYLREANRVCVALSRAKEGLYIIGNFTMLEKKCTLWRKIIKDARERGKVGSTLYLRCQNHPETNISISKPEDFLKVKDGGCKRKCRFQLKCGHVCQRLCHPDDIEHLRPCKKNCERKICKRDHVCKKLCYEECGPCIENVEIILPKCNHSQIVKCSENVLNVKCQQRCEKIIACGHRCQKHCGEPCTSADNCQELEKIKAKCGHELQAPCCTKANPICKVPCNEKLLCGHICKGTCSSCSQKRLHQPCRKQCEKVQVCGHTCREKCIVPCPPCKEKCNIRCKHRDCRQKCGEACIECIEPCDWACVKDCPNGYRCRNRCCEICDRPRCDTPCTRLLRCGHECPGLLCEKCPDKCKICNGDELQEIFFGTEDETGARFIQLEDCKCVFEVDGLDHFMEINARDDAITLTSKRCPKCSTLIVYSRRYGNILKSQRNDVESVHREIESHDSGQFDKQKAELIEKRNNVESVFGYFKNESRPFEFTTFQKISVVKIREVKMQREIGLIKNVLNFLGNINDVSKQVEILDTQVRIMKKHESFLKMKLCSLFNWVMQNRIQFSSQELEEFQTEMTRTAVLMDYVMLLRDARNQISEEADDVEANVINIIDELQSPVQYPRIQLKKLEDKLKELRKKVPQTGVGISKREQVMIIQAMSLPVTGHWYKCRNGHIYSIGECGHAMEQMKCPHCDVMIGGGNHRLNENNTRAEEMEINLDG